MGSRFVPIQVNLLGYGLRLTRRILLVRFPHHFPVVLNGLKFLREKDSLDPLEVSLANLFHFLNYF